MMSDDNIENILKSSLWMVLLTILMIWAPVVGPIVAGIVGVKRKKKKKFMDNGHLYSVEDLGNLIHYE